MLSLGIGEPEGKWHVRNLCPNEEGREPFPTPPLLQATAMSIWKYMEAN